MLKVIFVIRVLLKTTLTKTMEWWIHSNTSTLYLDSNECCSFALCYATHRFWHSFFFSFIFFLIIFINPFLVGMSMKILKIFSSSMAQVCSFIWTMDIFTCFREITITIMKIMFSVYLMNNIITNRWDIDKRKKHNYTKRKRNNTLN